MVSMLRKLSGSCSEIRPIIAMSCSTMNTKGRLAAVTQMTATSDRDKNLETCVSLIATAASRGAEMVFLPEAFDYIGETREQSVTWSQDLDGPLVSQFQDFARKYNVWLSLGGMHEKGDSTKVRNTQVILDNFGTVKGTYRKTHLYDVNLPEQGIRLAESDYCIPGQEIELPVETPVGKVAMSICYDVRFPELAIAQRLLGADVLTYPSAFTLQTGLAHWEPLLRARAVENQCYVIAAAQTGQHNSRRTSYGHAMIVNPWGSVIAQCGDGTDVALANIDLSYLQRLREEMPVMRHRRFDLYPSMYPSNVLETFPDDDEEIAFGHVKIKGKMVFACTQLSVASVNRKCVVPGHVLVLPRRSAHRLEDLNAMERNDIFELATTVQEVVEKFYDASSSTLTIQDGEEAGQTVKHFHIHIMPRKTGDFSDNDMIYKCLALHDKGDVEWRKDEEMEEESKKLRATLRSISS